MEQTQSQAAERVLSFDCSLRKNIIAIKELGNDDPLYLGKMNRWTLKTVWRTGPAAAKALTSDSDSDSNVPGNDIIGEGRVHAFHIDCDTMVRGRPIRVSAARKWLTRYNYPSTAYSSDPSRPAVMTWHSNSKWKAFDFDLRDENEELVARFSPRYIARKTANIELFGSRAWDTAAVEEVLITGITLYLCMIYRASNLVPFIGAAVSRSGKDYNVTEQQTREKQERNLATTADEFLAPQEAKFETPDNIWDRVHEGTMMKEPEAKETSVQ